MNSDYIKRIVDACPIEFYLSANDGVRVHWPYRMQPVHEASSTYAADADRYVIDSSFADESITNQDTLDKAHALGASGAVLEDVYQDYAGTVEKLQEGRQLADTHPFDGEIYYPLQAPHVECWKTVGRPKRIAIGGVKDKPASEKVRIAQHIRDAVGESVWIHGLGYGATPEVISAIRSNPQLLDSIDAQTPLASAKSSDVWPGTEVMTPVALRSLANLTEKCRRMTPEFTDNPSPNQTGLSDY